MWNGCEIWSREALRGMIVNEPQGLAERALSTALSCRWRHVQAVARRAAEISAIPHVDGEVLLPAAWLHDIGYAPELVDTRFHPLDGARYLRRLGTVPERVLCLVAHHSCAVIEADMRGLAVELRAEFPEEKSPTADALWYADMTTGPDGQHFQVGERLAEIQQRYGPDHTVTRFVDRARGEILAAVGRTEAGLAAARKSLR
jgi:HD domain